MIMVMGGVGIVGEKLEPGFESFRQMRPEWLTSRTRTHSPMDLSKYSQVTDPGNMWAAYSLPPTYTTISFLIFFKITVFFISVQNYMEKSPNKTYLLNKLIH